ncbi:MAG: class I SAM-dependent methyltransferase [Alphaproteobacteria bacterium]
MSESSAYDAGNEGKRDFGSIYNQPQPAPYFEALRKLDYAIPGEAKPLFQQVIDARREAQRSDDVTMLDLGCSYGINAALLKYDLAMDQLYDWYDEREAATTRGAVDLDRRFFAERDRQDGLAVVGIDPAERAIEYAVEAGLLDAGISANLEDDPLPAQDLEKVRGVDLITATGSIGYVTERTFRKLLPAVDAGRAPWIATFVLRMFPYDEIIQTLGEHGFTTEKLPGVHFPQRRFADAEEAAHVRARLEEIDIDPAPEMSEHGYVAEFYLSRPSDAARQRPLADLLRAYEPAPRASSPLTRGAED